MDNIIPNSSCQVNIDGSVEQFLDTLMFSGMLGIICGEGFDDINQWYFITDVKEIRNLNLPASNNIFFTPATRTRAGNKKEDVLGSVALWADWDSSDTPELILPPSAVVRSGNGYHLYYFLEEPTYNLKQLEKANKALVYSLASGDRGTWNCNRVLRFPNSFNHKDPNNPKPVHILDFDVARRYKLEDFLVLEKLPKKTIDKILTGDSKGFKSRSERDLSVINYLVYAGASDELIELIFSTNKIGEKLDEKNDGGTDYLARTIEKARDFVGSEAFTPHKSTYVSVIEIAEEFAERHGKDWMYDEERDTWYGWCGSHWTAYSDKTPMKLDAPMVDLFKEYGVSVSGRAVNDAIRFARSYCAGKLKAKAGLVNFDNGTFNLETSKLQAFNREDGLTYCLPYPYVPAPHQQIDQFLAENIPDDVARNSYIALIGLALIGDTSIHKFGVLLGKPGSGKSTLLGLANVVCGYPYEQAFSFAGASIFSRDTEGKRARAKWNHHRIVCVDEVPVEAFRNEETIKGMAAHSGAEARLIGKDETTNNRWIPKLLLATNDHPRFPDRANALAQRMIIIPCPNKRNRNTPKAVTLNMLQSIIDEVPAFAATCITQALEALEHTTILQSAEQEQLLQQIVIEGDSVKSFIFDRCEFDKNEFSPTHVLYKQYTAYCWNSGNKAMSRNNFSNALVDGYSDHLKLDRKRVDGKQERGIVGLKLLPKEIGGGTSFSEISMKNEMSRL